jgi:hypothetical protein
MASSMGVMVHTCSHFLACCSCWLVVGLCFWLCVPLCLWYPVPGCASSQHSTCTEPVEG